MVEQARWPHGPVCPKCGGVDHASRVTARTGQFQCLDCRKTLSVTSGTPMHKTHLSVCVWIIAFYLIATSSKGISSLKLASLLGLQCRTTWHLTRRSRSMMGSNPELLSGIVELDGTHMGGKPRAKNKPQRPQGCSTLPDCLQSPPCNTWEVKCRG